MVQLSFILKGRYKMSESKNRVEKIAKQVQDITEFAQTKDSGAAKYITDRCNTIARTEDKRLNIVVDKKTGEILEKPNVSYRYYTQIMEGYRSAIKSLNFKHHAIEKHVNAFINKYSDSVDNLEEMLDPELPIETLRENLIKLRANARSGSSFKSDLLKLRIEHHAYYMFEPKGSYKDFISDQNSKNLKAKLLNQVQVNPEWIKSLTTSLLTKDDPSVSDLAIGIAIATGRRLTEVMKTGELKAVNKSTLLFSGQLKTKNRHLFEEIKPYEIPSMIDSGIVCKALKRLRKETKAEPLIYKNVRGEEVTSTVLGGDKRDYSHNSGINKKYSPTLNRNIKGLLQDGYFSFKDCRALYTEVTYEEHAKEGESRSAYRHRVLGHSLIETQIHYESFKLDSNIEKIKVIIKGEENEASGDVQKALVEYLSKADEEVKCYARAPKVAIIHDWLKQKVADGLTHEEITASYIRRFCLIDGKQTNLNTIKKYLDEFVKISEFVPPKEKPKSKLDEQIRELEEELEMATDRQDEILDERTELEEEKEELIARLPEIDEELEKSESEAEAIEEQIEDLTEQLDELRQQKADEESKEAGDQKTDKEKQPEVVWPDANDIDVEAKKVGKYWKAQAIVNGQVFEVEQPGTKKQAIADVRSLYKSEINE
jgi:hypothetical protein